MGARNRRGGARDFHTACSDRPTERLATGHLQSSKQRAHGNAHLDAYELAKAELSLGEPHELLKGRL